MQYGERIAEEMREDVRKRILTLEEHLGLVSHNLHTDDTHSPHSARKEIKFKVDKNPSEPKSIIL